MNRFELKRQAFHTGVGLLFVVLISLQPTLDFIEKIGYLLPLNELPALSRFLLLILIPGGVLILLSKKYQIPGVEKLLKHFERKEIRKKFPGKGAFFFTVGAFILTTLIPYSGVKQPIRVVAASLLILAVGDSTSHIIGREFGKIKHPFSNEKNIEGHVAGALLGGLGASFFVSPPLAFVAAFIAMFIEGIHFGEKADQILEDNIIVPIAASIVIILLTPLFA